MLHTRTHDMIPDFFVVREGRACVAHPHSSSIKLLANREYRMYTPLNSTCFPNRSD